MKTSTLTKLGLLGLSLLAAPAQATLIAYWDMDASTVSGKLAPNAGSQAGSISTSIYEIDVGFDSIVTSVSGTTDNMLPPPPATNRALGFYHVGTVYYSGAFLMEGFDFTGLSDVSISFAYQSENFFTWDSNLEVDYRINGGS